MNILKVYNNLQEHFKGKSCIKESDIIKILGQENFVLLVRNFMIIRVRKDEDGTVWYEL